MGALVVGIILLGVGVVFGMAAASGVGGGNTGGGIGDILGSIIAQGFAMLIVLAFIALALGALGAWLYRVAHNRCIDQLRRPAPAGSTKG